MAVEPNSGRRAPLGVLVVEPASREDLADLAMLLAARDAHYAEWEGPSGFSDAEYRERIAAALFGERPYAEALIARRAGRPVGVGFFGMLFPGARLSPAVFLKEMFVLEAERGAGVGRAILARLRRIARGRGADRVELHVHPLNARARAFYRREGLKEIERVVTRVDL